MSARTLTPLPLPQSPQRLYRVYREMLYPAGILGFCPPEAGVALILGGPPARSSVNPRLSPSCFSSKTTPFAPSHPLDYPASGQYRLSLGALSVHSPLWVVTRVLHGVSHRFAATLSLPALNPLPFTAPPSRPIAYAFLSVTSRRCQHVGEFKRAG